jgi:hypothetical protein
MSDFIESYPNALDPGMCRQIIEQFEASGQAVRGETGSGVDTKLKNSYDILITGRPDWQHVEGTLQAAAFAGLKHYIRKYPFALMGALALRFQDPQTGQIILVNAETFPQLSEQTYEQLLVSVFRSGTINLQKYLAGQGGYPHWHSELYPRDPHAETLHRVLLYSFYLNDVPADGETEFLYQARKIRPQAGTLLIAPAGFTHTHRGNTPQGGNKYIATSWVLFQRAEVLYGGS